MECGPDIYEVNITELVDIKEKTNIEVVLINSPNSKFLNIVYISFQAAFVQLGYCSFRFTWISNVSFFLLTNRACIVHHLSYFIPFWLENAALVDKEEEFKSDLQLAIKYALALNCSRYDYM